MTQQNRQPGQEQTGQAGRRGQTGGAREGQSGKGSGTGASQQQPDNASAGGEETPEQWLEENSLGNPDETGNTITGENEY